MTSSDKRKLQKEMAGRNAIEGKFGQGKNGYGLEKIKARMKETSESWILSIYFIMNLVKLSERAFLHLITTMLQQFIGYFLALERNYGRNKQLCWTS